MVQKSDPIGCPSAVLHHAAQPPGESSAGDGIKEKSILLGLPPLGLSGVDYAMLQTYRCRPMMVPVGLPCRRVALSYKRIQ